MGGVGGGGAPWTNPETGVCMRSGPSTMSYLCVARGAPLSHAHGHISNASQPESGDVESSNASLSMLYAKWKGAEAARKMAEDALAEQWAQLKEERARLADLARSMGQEPLPAPQHATVGEAVPSP